MAGGALGVYRIWSHNPPWGMLAAICGAYLEVAEVYELVEVTLTGRVQYSACLSIIV